MSGSNQCYPTEGLIIAESALVLHVVIEALLVASFSNSRKYMSYRVVMIIMVMH